MQGVKVKENFYPFDLRGTDAVLGVEWLESFGEVRVDWKISTLKINIDGKLVCLKGDPSLSKSQITLKTMKGGNHGYLVEFGEMTLVEQSIKPVPEEIQALLKEYKDVCEMRSTLPSTQFRDHAIQIKLGEQPPNVRPYR